jgi:signal transduction histidine kinase/DNA-binding response OmpR family regulator/ligand-binding sensor domain-containing protein
MHLFLTKAISILFFLWLNFCLVAQNPKLETISIQQGLSQGMIYDMLQDSDGFMWMGTNNGLNRYNGYNFRVFTHNPFDTTSISGDVITKLFEDSQNRLWAGTRINGLNYFDKYHERFYKIDFSTVLPNQQENLNISSIDEDKAGNIWVTGNDFILMVTVIQPSISEVPVFKVELKSQIPSNSIEGNILTVKCLSDGRILIGSHWTGLFEWNTKANRLEPFITPTGEKITSANFILEYPKGQIWISSFRTIYRLNEQTVKIYTPPYIDREHSSRRVRFAVNPQNGKLWIFYYFKSTIYELDISKGETATLQPVLELPKNVYATCLFFEDERNFWLGTNGYGLRKMPLLTYPFHHLAKGKSIRNINQFKPGALSFTAQTGMEVINNVATHQQTTIPIQKHITSLNVNDIFGVLKAKNGDIWLSSRYYSKNEQKSKLYKYNSQYQLLKTYQLPKVDMYYGAFIEDQKGNLWFGTTNGQFVKFDVQTELFIPINCSHIGNGTIDAQVFQLYLDIDGKIWKASAQGLSVITLDKNGNLKDCTTYETNPKNIKSLSYNSVASILDDPIAPKEYLWVATKGGGLNKLNKETGEFQHFKTQQGLPDNVVYGVLADAENHIWVSTNRGLAKLNPQTGKFTSFQAEDGLQDNEFNTGAFFKDKNTGQLFFGGINGITAFYPHEINLGNYHPKVYITQLKIKNEIVNVGQPLKNKGQNPLSQSIEYTKKIKLTWFQNQITLEFAALDLNIPSKNQYQYQLSGVDKDWVQAGNNRIANYANLTPGRYIFRVKGTNSSGQWSDKEATLEIIITPPWWRTIWAYLLYTAIIISSILLWLRFQTNKIKLENELAFQEREAERLAELDKIKTNFFSNITHEFRTPLHLIIEPLRQALTQPNKPWRNHIELAKNNSEKLLQLINQLLDLSKLESKKMKLELQTGDILNVISPIINSFKILAQQKNINLIFQAPEHIPSFDFDKDKVEKVLFNLLSNAIKFTPKSGQIIVTVHNENQQLSITVADTGIGISTEQQTQIFNRFYQVKNRKQTGTGIGLALSKELTEVMNGTLNVESKLGIGSTFIIQIPMVRTAQKSKAVISNNNFHYPNAIENTPVNDNIALDANNIVLLIEDNAELRAFIKNSIQDKYQVIEASNGQQGIQLALQYIPNIIISDVMMPEKDGFELCNFLKTEEKTAHIPIVLLTAKTAFDSKLKGLKYGADAYITKPFNTNELLVRIENLITLRQQLQVKYSQAFNLSPSSHAGLTTQDNQKIIISEYDQIFLNNAQQIVMQHLDDETLTVEILANKVAMSRGQLHRKLRALLDQSPSEFIRNIRLKEAFILLQQRKGNVTEVAFMVGFSSQKYFSTKFKEKYQISPKEVT